MSKREYLRRNRKELDEYIQKNAPGAPRNDRERWLWVINDIGWYHDAKRKGVAV